MIIMMGNDFKIYFYFVIVKHVKLLHKNNAQYA